MFVMNHQTGIKHPGRRPRLAYIFISSPATFHGYRNRQRKTTPCHCKATEGDSNFVSLNVASQGTNRRAFLHAAAVSTVGLLTCPAESNETSEDTKETFTSDNLAVTVTYPRSWFRSERAGSLVLISLKDVSVATISQKPVVLSSRQDPFSAAYDCIQDRAEKEGTDIVINDAKLEGDALSFSFRTETLLPTGDSIIRFGIGQALPTKDNEKALVCIFTGPKETWDHMGSIAEGIVNSIRLVR